MPPNGKTSNDHLFAGGRRRRRSPSRGRMRAWWSDRERVADASSRHFAVSPPRLLAVAATTHAPLDFYIISTLYLLSLRSVVFSSCTPYFYSVLIYPFAWPCESLHSRRIIHVFVARPRPLLSRCSFVFAERFAPHLRSVATLSAVRRSAFAFNQISLLNVNFPHYRLSRRASRA